MKTVCFRQKNISKLPRRLEHQRISRDYPELEKRNESLSPLRPSKTGINQSRVFQGEEHFGAFASLSIGRGAFCSETVQITAARTAMHVIMNGWRLFVSVPSAGNIGHFEFSIFNALVSPFGSPGAPSLAPSLASIAKCTHGIHQRRATDPAFSPILFSPLRFF